MVVIELVYRKGSTSQQPQPNKGVGAGEGGARVPRWKQKGAANKPMMARFNSFVPVTPWIASVNKIKPKRIRVMPKSKRSIFDKPEIFYRKKKPRPRSKRLRDVDEVDQEEIKLVLDMSPDGPTFAMLEAIMKAAREEEAGCANGIGKKKKKSTYEKLTKLLKSGIPGKHVKIRVGRFNSY